MKAMRLRPHHLLDIVAAHGGDSGFAPHPYGHDLHRVARDVLRDLDLLVEFVVGADEICLPCKHLQPNGLCDDVLRQLDPPISKQEYNDGLDRRLFAYLGLSPGSAMPVRRFLSIVSEKTPGIEKVCAHPGEDRKLRLQRLARGLVKLGVKT